MNQMKLARELVRERQRALLTDAAAGHQAVRVRTRARAARRADRAERQLARSWDKAVRLRGELTAVEQHP
jgi:hypothetical protein